MVLLHCSSLTKISISSFRWCILEQGKRCSRDCATVSIMHIHTSQKDTNLETIWSLSVCVIPGCPTPLGCRLKRIRSRAWGGQMRHYIISFLRWNISDVTNTYWSNSKVSNKKLSKIFKNFCTLLYYIIGLSCNREQIKIWPYFGTAHSSPDLPTSL